MFKLKTVDMLMMTYGIRELCPYPSPLFGARGMSRIIGHLIENREAPSFNLLLHLFGGSEWHEEKSVIRFSMTNDSKRKRGIE